MSGGSELPSAVEVGARDVVHVVVHADEAGEDGAAAQVDHDLATGCGHVGTGLDGGDLAVFNHHVLIFDRRFAASRR